MALGPDHHGRLLPADRSPVEGRQVVRGGLQRVEEIVEVLDVADRAQASHGRTDRLAEDRRLPNTGVGEAQLSVLRLQTLEDEVDVAQPPHVFTDHENPWVTSEVGVEVAHQDLPAVDDWRFL